VQDEAIYRCINEACARTMPRVVKFCPYCGSAQTAAVRTQAPVHAGAAAGGAASPASSGWSDAPDNAAAAAALAASTAAAATAATAASAATSATSATTAAAAASAQAGRKPPQAAAPPPNAGATRAPAAAAPSATAFGHSGRLGAAPQAPPAPPERARGIPWSRTPRPPAPPGPNGRTPVRLRWWLLLLAVFALVWLVAKPSAKKLERRIDAAIAQAQDCKARSAQDELIALRAAHATPAQLARLQRAMNEASAGCTRKRQRDKAWNEASGAAEIALAAGNFDKARTRLQTFTRRWGEDDNTRGLRDRIEAGRHPLAAPETGANADAPSHTMQSARNLITEARADLARGDADAARDKMDLCLTMVDPSDRDCAALKAEAQGNAR
jgi:hypothetical protein